jgi:hypothetical protein
MAFCAPSSPFKPKKYIQAHQTLNKPCSNHYYIVEKQAQVWRRVFDQWMSAGRIRLTRELDY